MAYVRTVKTSSGATAVQIVWSSRRGSRPIEHLGSARDEAALAALKAAAVQRLAAGQAELDLGVAVRSGSEPLPITSSRATHLWEVGRDRCGRGVVSDAEPPIACIRQTHVPASTLGYMR